MIFIIKKNENEKRICNKIKIYVKGYLYNKIFENLSYKMDNFIFELKNIKKHYSSFLINSDELKNIINDFKKLIFEFDIEGKE